MQTANGKIIVIDGGRRGNEALYLLSYLRNLTGQAVPHVDAWIHTHAHSDHVYAYLDIAEKYPNSITLDRLYCNYPTNSELQAYCADNNPDSVNSAIQAVYSATKKLKNAQGGAVEVLELNSRHTGKCNSSFDIDDVHFDVLLTFDDMISATKTLTGTYTCTMDTHNTNYDKKTLAQIISNTTNNTTMVCRATVGGKTILFLGDAAAGCSIVLESYHAANKKDSTKYFSLKSDVVQMAHHGGRNGQSKASYQAIDPDVSLWPCTGVTHEATGGSATSSTNPKAWLTALGAEIHPAYKGPQIFYFGTPRNSTTVSIPEKVKPFVFDAKYYADRYPELKAVYGYDEAGLYAHFVNYGIEEGRCASPYFDVVYYANHNNINLTEYAKGDYEKAMNHFLSYMDNTTEMSSAPKRLSVNFDPAYYRSTYSDLSHMTTEFQLLQHFGTHGNYEGRKATKSAVSENEDNYHHSCTFIMVDAHSHMVKCSSCGASYAQEHTYVYGLCACGAVQSHTVRFYAEDGTVLQESTVADNGSLSYTAQEPTKDSDESAHYLFSHWAEEDGTQAELECVAKDLELYPVFTAETHEEELRGTTAPTCTEPGYTGDRICRICEYVFVVGEWILATGHSYSYTNQGEDHIASCACGNSFVQAHSYTDGMCICGQAEEKEPVEEPTWKLSHSLNLASDISVNLVILKSALEGFDMDTVYVESIIDTYERNEKTGTEILRLEPVETDRYYYFILTGITAVQMNDTIRSVLYGTKDGRAYYSPVDEYSIATYAYGQMNKAEATAELKTLCADLLRYGAKAQLYKEYRTEALADFAMTETHKAYLSDMETLTFGNNNVVQKDVEQAHVTWAGKALDLASKVTVKYVFDVSEYEGETKDLCLHVSYLDVAGETQELVLVDAQVYDSSRGLYFFAFDGLLAAELREVVSAQIYAEGTPVSATLQYSADTYGNGKTGILADLCKALFAYSDSAKTYFVK